MTISLEEHVARLREALEPFVRLTADAVSSADRGRQEGDDWFEDSDSAASAYGWALALTWGDLRLARAAYEMSGVVK